MTDSNSTNNKPVHTLRLGTLQAAIWANQHDGKTYHSVTLSRGYTDEEGKWHNTDSFGFNDLLPLRKLADQAHSWIAQEQQQSKENWAERAVQDGQKQAGRRRGG